MEKPYWLHIEINMPFACPEFILQWKIPYAQMLESYYWGNLDLWKDKISFDGGG